VNISFLFSYASRESEDEWQYFSCNQVSPSRQLDAAIDYLAILPAVEPSAVHGGADMKNIALLAVFLLISTVAHSQARAQTSANYDAKNELETPNSSPQVFIFTAQNNQQAPPSPQAQRPRAKSIPIPTQWPDAKPEPIPTNWPNLKLLLIAPATSDSNPAR
jgi:outer membrane biosynthesis protein TonB